MPREVTIKLNGQCERRAAGNPFGLPYPPLYHQVRTVEALERSDLVLNTYNTGTGKTQAALLHLLRMPAAPNHNALIIAPTNELVRQHHADVETFISDQKLNWYVLPPVDAETLRAERDKERTEVDEYARNARVLHKMINNPRAYVHNPTDLKPVVMVTNPDLFYYCLYHCYRGGELDARNLFGDMIAKFEYIVIDEFHYYNPKQFANFLFFFALCRRFGYFDGMRRICLLSATPSDAVRTYLHRLAQLPGEAQRGMQFRWEEVSPNNEPPEAQALPTTPALAPLQMTLVADPFALSSQVKEDAEHIQSLLATDRDGVVLSGSLACIADVQAELRRSKIPEEAVGVITGPAGRAERESAKNKPLILATPTVDIGYNFGRINKNRQSVDFLYADARDSSSLLQRIGRAGRVLGKDVTDSPSHAVVCVPSSLVEAVLKAGKTEWDRAEFAQTAREALKAPTWAESYLQSWALLELYLPLYELETTVLEGALEPIRALFADVRTVFAPESDVTPDRLAAKIRAYRDRKQLCEAPHKRDAYTERLWKRAAVGYVRRRFWEDKVDFDAQPEAKQQECIRGVLFSRGRTKVLEYAAAGHERMQSLLTFRGGGIDLTCAVYDPYRVLPSGADVCAYDLMHLLQRYDITRLTREQFLSAARLPAERCDCYAKLERRALKRHPVRLGLSADDLTIEQFKRRRCHYPVAIKGFRLEGVPDGFGDLLTEPYVTCLITTWRQPQVLANAIEWPELRAWPLHVVLKDGEEEFSVVLGAAAFMAHAELRRLWREGHKEIEEPREEPQDEEQSAEVK